MIIQYDASYEERISIREYPNGTVEFTKGMCLDLLITMQMFLNFRFVSDTKLSGKQKTVLLILKSILSIVTCQ